MRLGRVPSCVLALVMATCFAGCTEGFLAVVPVPVGAPKLLGRSATAAVVRHENGAVGALGEHQRVGHAVLEARVAGLREALGGCSASGGRRLHVLVAAVGKEGEDGASGAGFGLEDKTIEVSAFVRTVSIASISWGNMISMSGVLVYLVSKKHDHFGLRMQQAAAEQQSGRAAVGVFRV